MTRSKQLDFPHLSKISQTLKISIDSLLTHLWRTWKIHMRRRCIRTFSDSSLILLKCKPVKMPSQNFWVKNWHYKMQTMIWSTALMLLFQNSVWLMVFLIKSLNYTFNIVPTVRSFAARDKLTNSWPRNILSWTRYVSQLPVKQNQHVFSLDSRVWQEMLDFWLGRFITLQISNASLLEVTSFSIKIMTIYS
jgi:hypothetical protein